MVLHWYYSDLYEFIIVIMKQFWTLSSTNHLDFWLNIISASFYKYCSDWQAVGGLQEVVLQCSWVQQARWVMYVSSQNAQLFSLLRSHCKYSSHDPYLVILCLSGLMRDDTIYENADVKEAIRRLPEPVYNDRMFRIKRALDLSLKHQILPKDQWTKFEEVRSRPLHLINLGDGIY